MMRLRLISPYLPDHDFSDYLIGEYLDILDVCNYTNEVPELVIRAPPNYATATPPSLTLTSIMHNDTMWCPGPNQLIATISLSQGATCNSISQAFNASTGDVQVATEAIDCNTKRQAFCLPPKCAIQQVPANATCDSLAASFSTPNLTVTSVQLLNWNKNINGLCDSLKPGDYVCASPPGGSYVPQPAPPGSASDGGQQRGGGDGSVISPTTSTLPSPLQNGTTSKCTLYAQAQSGGGCATFTDEFNISLDQLAAWNPVLGVGGANCRTLFWALEWYCVAGPSISTTTSVSSTTTKSTSTSPGPPSPIQTGVSTKCNKYAMATSQDLCWSFAQKYNITTDQLYAWNLVLGNAGSNCNTAFWVGEYYCIGVKP